MKQIISGLITLLILVGINYVVSESTNINYIDLSFIVGLFTSVVIGFFTSKGGVTTTFTDATMQSHTTNFKMKNEKHTFVPNLAFYIAVLYTLLSIVCTLIYYKDYFIN